MNDVLLPIEEGRDASAAVRRAIALNREAPVRVHLLNVRTPLPSYVARFIPPDVFKAEVDRHINDLASSQRLPGVEDIRVPGQGRAGRRKERERNGVPLSAALVAQVDEVAKSLGIVPLSARS